MRTENIACEKRYQDWRAQHHYLFVPENRLSQQDEQSLLMDGYYVRSKAYFYNGDIYLNGSENELIDQNGTIIYTWRNLDTDGKFCTMFCHSNGKHDLVFCIEPYGYSILEVETRKEIHYVPACVHPEAGEHVEEVFIWTSADYDSRSNLLAVTGCIWACPYSTIVLDFSNPLHLQTPEEWLDLRKIVDPNGIQFDDVEFICWEDDAVILQGSSIEDGKWKEVQVLTEQLRTELLNMKKKSGGIRL